MTKIPTHAQTLREDFDKWFRRATGKPGGSPAVNRHGGTSLASGGFSRRSLYGVAFLALSAAVPERRPEAALVMTAMATVMTKTRT